MYQVIVWGSIFYETKDLLIADAMAHSYRESWWGPNGVKVRKVRKQKKQRIVLGGN